MTVDIAFVGGELATQVHITRVTGHVSDGSPQPRVQVARVEGFAAGGPAPTPALVQIAGLHGFAQDPGPLPGVSLLAQWDGERWVRLPVVTWDGTSWVGAS